MIGPRGDLKPSSRPSRSHIRGGQTESRRSNTRLVGDVLELPIILVAALEATNTPIGEFITRLVQRSVWRDQGIHRSNREITIHALLTSERLRLLVRIERSLWYQHPHDTIHVYGYPDPVTLLSAQDLALSTILRHPVLDPLPIRALAVRYMNPTKTDLGISIHVEVPKVLVDATAL